MPSRAVAELMPRLPFVVVGAAVTAAFGAALIGPAAGGRAEPPPSTVVVERTLQFEDRADGAVVVREGGAQVAVFEGEQGFVRGILRGFARNRRMQGIGAAEPFHLAAWADGRITMDDTATRQRFELQAFGPSNVNVFIGLLPGVPPVPQPVWMK